MKSTQFMDLVIIFFLIWIINQTFLKFFIKNHKINLSITFYLNFKMIIDLMNNCENNLIKSMNILVNKWKN